MVQALRKRLPSIRFRFLAKEPVSNLSHILSNKQIRDVQSTSSQDGPLFDRSHCQCHLWNFRGAGQLSKTGPNPLFGEVLQTRSIEMISGCLFSLVKYGLLKCLEMRKSCSRREMGLFPKNDDIQKVLNFYKPPIYIYSMHIVWHQVTSILETVFLFWNEKNQSKKCWTPEMSKVVDVFFLRKKNASLFRRICARNTWISQMQMAMPAMLS